MTLVLASSSAPVPLRLGGTGSTAFDLLMEADADDLLARIDLPVLGEIAYAAGHLDVTIEAWERAYATCMQAGDQARPPVRPSVWRCSSTRR